jgi:hypothetical protein
MNNLSYDDEWGEWIPKILDEYIAEYPWMAMHRSWILFRE